MEERLSLCEPQKNGCVLWVGPHRRGYPDAQILGQHVSVTRWVLAKKLNRELAPDECACHSCDTPMCVNPDHLFVGTHADNKLDCVQKERHSRGEKVNTAKLTADAIERIRTRRGESSYKLAREFGVCRTTINRIMNKQYWKHV